MSTLTNALPTPLENECIRCYLEHTVDAAACDGTLRAVARYQEHATCNGSELIFNIKQSGIFCDCEFRMNKAQLEDDANRSAQKDLICRGINHPNSIAGCANWTEFGPWANHEAIRTAG